MFSALPLRADIAQMQVGMSVWCQHATSTDTETANQRTKTGRLKADDQLNSLQSSRIGHRHQLAASSVENILAFCVNSSRSSGLAYCRSVRADPRPPCPDLQCP